MANLFRPEKGIRVDSKWKLAWEITSPKFMYIDDEKTKRQHKLKMSPKQVKALQQARRSKQEARQGKSKQSVQSKQSQPKQLRSSFSDLMKSWDASAKKAKQHAEIVEKPKMPKTDNKVPMQSFLRPANIVGGGFGRTNTGMVPRFVRSYWDRHAITA